MTMAMSFSFNQTFSMQTIKKCVILCKFDAKKIVNLQPKKDAKSIKIC